MAITMKPWLPQNRTQACLMTLYFLHYVSFWYWKKTNPETWAMVNDIRLAESLLDGDTESVIAQLDYKLKSAITYNIASSLEPETDWQSFSSCFRRFLADIPGLMLGRLF